MIGANPVLEAPGLRGVKGLALLASLAACAPSGRPPVATVAGAGAPAGRPSVDVVAAPLEAEDRDAPSDVPPEGPSVDPSREAPPLHPELEPFRVGHERAVWTLPSRDGGRDVPLVYLHGRCGDPKAFAAFGHAAAERGTVVSFVGDEPCKDGQRFKWSGDVVSLDRRISRTLAALDAAKGTKLASGERAVIGYSQGSLMAEALGTRFPERYPRVVLIGGPRAPREDSLSKSKAILLMAGTRDLRAHLREARDDLAQRGRTVRYVELEGARHGEYGPAAEPTMAEALDWLLGVAP